MPVRKPGNSSGSGDVVASNNLSDLQSISQALINLGLGNVVNAKHKLDGITAPTVNNDITESYSIGSTWTDVTGDAVYYCVDNTSGSAVWKNLSASGGSVSWGDITGTLGNQTDLKALAGKDTIDNADLVSAGVIAEAKLDGTLANKINNKSDKVASVKEETGTTYTLVATDLDKYIHFTNASPITVTIPKNTTTALDVGFVAHGVQHGVGQVTIEGASGVTIDDTKLSTIAQNSAFFMIKTATDTWGVKGSLEA